jgi:hypothetical protein
LEAALAAALAADLAAEAALEAALEAAFFIDLAAEAARALVARIDLAARRVAIIYIYITNKKNNFKLDINFP